MTALVAALCDESRRVKARMTDLPIYNPALAIEAALIRAVLPGSRVRLTRGGTHRGEGRARNATATPR